MGDDPGLFGDVVAVPVDREHRAVLLRFWLGVAAARSRLYRRVSWGFRGRASIADPAVSAMDGVPSRVRRRHDQDARRYIMARFHGHELSSPNPADAQSAQQVGTPETAVVA